MTSDALAISDRESFIDQIYDTTMGVIEVRAIPPDRRPGPSMFSDDARIILSAIDSANRRGENCYVGVAARKRGSSRGSKKDLASCRVLWIDYDWGAEGVEGARLFQAKIDGFSIAPSMVISSGNGRHVYWRLKEAIDLSVDSNRLWLEATLRGLAREWGSDPAVTDASRIMRVPGTTNYPNAKKRAEGRIVRQSSILELAENAIYARESFQRFTALGSRHDVNARESNGEAQIEWPDQVRLALARRTSLRSLFSYTPQSSAEWVKATGEPNFSKFDFVITKELIEEGVSRRDIAAACRALRLANGGDHPKIHGDDYWDRTFSGAYDQVDPRKRRPRWWYESGKGCDLKRAISSIDLQDVKSETPSPGFKRTDAIPLGIDEIDHATGGIYGLTIVSGLEGCGKTILALMATVSAAKSGIPVVYFNVETVIDVIGERVRLQLGGVTYADMLSQIQRVKWVRFQRAVEEPLRVIKSVIVDSLSNNDDRVLVVFDSLSSITRMLIPRGRSHDFWRECQEIEEWMVRVRTATKGAVTFLCISELNKEGVEKGMTSKYAGDVVMRMERSPDGQTVIAVRKSRETEQPNDAVVALDPTQMRFVSTVKVEDHAEDNVINLDEKRQRRMWYEEL